VTIYFGEIRGIFKNCIFIINEKGRVNKEIKKIV